jgi:integrase
MEHLGGSVQLIRANPLQKLGKKLGLGLRGKKDRGEIKALDPVQLARFLAAVLMTAPELFPIFAVMAWADTRLGKALGLRWEAVNLEGGKLRVDRQFGGTTKTDTTREVDMADPLRDVLADLLSYCREEAFTQGETPSPWVLFPEFGENPDRKAEARVVKRVRNAMARCLKAADLPLHFTPHSLRHSFGSQLIAAGVSPAYVMQQMGHSSIQMTVDVYGSWLPVKVEDAVNRLAAASSPWSGDKVATERGSGPSEGPSGQGSGEGQLLAGTGTERKAVSPNPAPYPRSPWSFGALSQGAPKHNEAA